MTNNEVFRRVRYLFNYNDDQMISLFELVNYQVSLSRLTHWFRKEDDPLFIEITDRELALFLNGLIIEKRGKREGPQPEPEDPLSNNMILRKLKIALDLKTDDILEMLAAIKKGISKHELSAFFRSPNHSSYRPCGDQYLRNFLNALKTKNRKN